MTNHTITQAKTRIPRETSLPSPTLIAFGVMLLITIVGLAWLAIALSDPSTLPIRKVMVEGEFNHLDPEDLQTVVIEAVDAGFFGVGVTEIQEILLNEPWIRDATIRRVWPDALRVSIVEQTPVARWGDHALLNEQADIFAPAPEQIPSDLARLNGPVGTELEVLKRYRYVFDELSPIRLALAEVNLSERHAWTITTAAGRTLVLGRKDFETRLTRFIFGYTHGLRAIWNRIGRIDMRYTNGFAVAEKAAIKRNG